jgi:hypothetical protein
MGKVNIFLSQSLPDVYNKTQMILPNVINECDRVHMVCYRTYTHVYTLTQRPNTVFEQNSFD